jgi:hypothetical protein
MLRQMAETVLKILPHQMVQQTYIIMAEMAALVAVVAEQKDRSAVQGLRSKVVRLPE